MHLIPLQPLQPLPTKAAEEEVGVECGDGVLKRMKGAPESIILSVWAHANLWISSWHHKHDIFNQ